MVIESPDQSDSTKDTNSTPAINLGPVSGAVEDAPVPHVGVIADTKEGSGQESLSVHDDPSQLQKPRTALNSLGDFVTWTPKNCRYNPNEPPKFSLSLNILFALVSLGKVKNATPVNGRSC